MSIGQRIAKGLIDRALALVLLAAASPLLLLVALWIKLVSRGTVLFVQQRVGLDEKPFRIYKLRTMHPGSDTHGLGSVTVRDDPRLFYGARLLRKFKIDELPQLFNVLNGTMSLVGPRPTVEADYRRMTAEQRNRASVKPGVTGLAQINGAAGLLWPQRIELDLAYIRNYSIGLDVQILWKTVWMALGGNADVNPALNDEWG
jgi:lipopolysaccharide/colanic/teichoic acid biosynthesis glycosyltransferase